MGKARKLKKCPKCQGDRDVRVRTVGEPTLDGWNKPVQPLQFKCFECSHIWEEKIRIPS